jgi:hypothetical protein
MYINQFILMSELKVIMNQEQRQKHINELLAQDGLSHIKEDPNAAYCFISLTSTPDEAKPFIKERQRILMEEVLKPAGITPYDPGSAPFSPDTNLTTQPSEVYMTDSSKIVGARFFTGHNIIPSSGQGIEAEKAKTYNRIAVILMDKNIRVSRMQPHRAIYLNYNNFQEQAKEFVSVFEMLKQYDPGMGFRVQDNIEIPVLIGFEKTTQKIVDLEQAVHKEFPHLKYNYDGKKDIVRLSVKNPDVFYENR